MDILVFVFKFLSLRVERLEEVKKRYVGEIWRDVVFFENRILRGSGEGGGRRWRGYLLFVGIKGERL